LWDAGIGIGQEISASFSSSFFLLLFFLFLLPVQQCGGEVAGLRLSLSLPLTFFHPFCGARSLMFSHGTFSFLLNSAFFTLRRALESHQEHLFFFPSPSLPVCSSVFFSLFLDAGRNTAGCCRQRLSPFLSFPPSPPAVSVFLLRACETGSGGESQASSFPSFLFPPSFSSGVRVFRNFFFFPFPPTPTQKERDEPSFPPFFPLPF